MCAMFSVKPKQAQKKDADGIFNPKVSRPKRPTAMGEDRILRRAKFMPEYTPEEMKGYVYGLKEGRERSVGITCVKRREDKIMDTISRDMLKPPSTIQSWLARWQKRGLHGSADEKSAGRPPITDYPLAKKIRKWLSKPPKDFGFKSIRWHLGMVQEKLHDEGIMASDDTVRRCMRPHPLLVPQAEACPPQVRLRGGAKGIQERCGQAHTESGLAGPYHSGV